MNNKTRLQHLFDDIYNKPANSWMEVQAQVNTLCTLANTINALPDVRQSAAGLHTSNRDHQNLRPMQQFNQDFWEGFNKYIEKFPYWPYKPISNATHQWETFYFKDMLGSVRVKIYNEPESISIHVTCRLTLRQYDFLKTNIFILDDSVFTLDDEKKELSLESKAPKEKDMSIIYEDVTEDLMALAKLVRNITL